MVVKGFFKWPNLHMLTKQESITSQKLDSWDFWQIANSVLNKGKSTIPPLFTSPEVLSFASDKRKTFTYLVKAFIRTLILMTHTSLYLFPF